MTRSGNVFLRFNLFLTLCSLEFLRLKHRGYNSDGVTCAHERFMSDVGSEKLVGSEKQKNGLHGAQSYVGIIDGTQRQSCMD